jgi:hypothetical protein
MPDDAFNVYIINKGARGSVGGWVTMLQAGRKVVGSILNEVIGYFQLTESFQPHYGPRVDSASNRNEYQESSWGGGKERPARKVENLTVICEPTVYKM